MLIYDTPTCQGMENALKRVRQMADIRWTPIRPYPCAYPLENGDQPAYFPAWRPQTGMPYSSARIHEKFVGYNVSFETFFTALSNPNSVLYTRNLFGQGARMAAWYGVVCSAMCSYALDLPMRYMTANWKDVPGMHCIEGATAADIRLCDTLCSKTHVAIVTDVARTADGTVHAITVTESTRPQCVRKTYTPEEFARYWLADYKVYRYAAFDRVAYTPLPYAPLPGDPPLPPPAPNPDLMPDYGDKANYASGETVELSLLTPGWTHVCVAQPGAPALRIAVEGREIVPFAPASAGVYEAYCTREGAQSGPVTFAVVASAVECPACVRADEAIEVRFLGAPPDSWQIKRAGTGFIAASLAVTDGQRASGSAPLPRLAPGAYTIQALSSNAFGHYASTPAQLTVKE